MATDITSEPLSASAEDLAKRFAVLAATWQQETAHLSNIAERADNPAYREIVAMGAPAVPLLLAELQRNPDDWFWALHAITGVDPVPKRSRGDVRQMAAAWLRWGRKQGLAA